ncbi:NAD-dependent epimerase/dehydratase family protein [Bacteroides cellulosilyticus]|uniref:NAD-dependent epimerase/dehydratase family protein n=1 Tax=Bacteroides cellulosilyticus TaxID=246787 RepID=UPI001898D588|nr:NAD-dependent epimerase/dehydratase family protein [Bacteroides cellulosilyticus]
MNSTILITGVAGFIGHALAKRLLCEGYKVVGIDNLIGEGEEKEIKLFRLAELVPLNQFRFYEIDITQNLKFLDKEEFELIVHLAARAGVRQSMKTPEVYVKINIEGFLNILEYAQKRHIKRIIYASSSSVYGNHNDRCMPFKESDVSEYHASIYAMTKKADEMLAYIYSTTYHIQTIGLRFFSVYGPYGRPDMAPWIFAKAILDGIEPSIYNFGEVFRDFTFIDDVISCLISIIDNKSIKEPYQIYNIGASKPHKVLELYEEIRKALGSSLGYVNKAIPAGDVSFTSADTNHLRQNYGIQDFTELHVGIQKFCNWFQSYYSSNSLLK